MNATYAGFWLRFVAHIIDSIVVYVAQSFVLVPILGLFGISFASNLDDMESMSQAETIGMIGGFIAFMTATWILTTAIAVLYGALMESSKYQATIGKMALGITVTDMNGQKLDLVKAVIRNLSKIVSTFIMCIGYLMVAFTEKKQGLHDLIAGTLVVKK